MSEEDDILVMHYRVANGLDRSALCGSEWARLTSIKDQVECEKCIAELQPVAGTEGEGL